MHIGGIGDFSSYKDIREILDRLGIVATAVDPHQHHFHVYLKPPALLDITANLMADQVNTGVADDQIAAQQLAVQTLLDYAPALITGEELMITMEVPYIPPQEVPIVLVQAADISKQPDYMLKTCAESTSGGGGTWVGPAGSLVGAVLRQERRQVSPQEGSALEATVKLTQLQGVAHGQLIPQSADGTPGGRVIYKYRSEPGYLGKDQAIFLAEYQGKRYKIVVNIIVSVGIDDNNSLCPPPPGQLIKITKPSSGFNGYDLNSITVTFADLSGGAVGQAVGNTITLDTNAAGHSWFIDTTPGSNEEFLPTSNPYEWVAKEGSAAYGKMDMLSVLLHEYGHALGIEHSADGHDYMATTLTAGVRRLPSAEELALMQQLVGEVKVEMASVSTQGSGNAPSQLPLLPLGGFGLAFLGRLRGTRYGSLNVEVDLSTLVTQYAVTANVKLTNGNFSVASGMPVDNGWATQGSVDFANGAATLKEVSTSQTRLNQVFVVNPRDRFLSFTIAGSVLDDVNGAPDDAFEVALLDANTGLSLAGALSLTHTDAMLNLQADGTETAASSVTRVTNADGSRTYRVDLAGIAVGTAVNLSFDLIGFGKDNSEVTIRDVRVSGLPVLHDDAATMNEDGSLSFDPFAQVDNAALLQLGSHVVDQPAHGSVMVNTDGTFVYSPAADYFGTDSFTYRLNDGPLESNLATVTVSIAAVNDAPVAGDVYATLAEDTPLQITLGNFATDVDSTTLSIQIVDGPSHGVLVANADGSYTYTPEANYFGADSFTYKANDSELDSNIATVSLNITPVNDAPVANDVAVYTLEDNQLVLNLLSSASDIDSPVDAQVFTATIVAAPAHGALSWNTDGSYTYTPDANFNGTDSFTYKVNDSVDGAGLDSNLATVSLTIGAVNDAPVVADAAVTTLEDTAIIIDLRTYATDVDSSIFTATIVAAPTHGTLIQNADGTYSYTPAENYFGMDSFTYRVNDSADGTGLDSNVATVSLTITAVNDAPLVADASISTAEDTAIIIDLRTYATDVDSTDFTPSIVTGPAYGTLTQNADGSYNYTPNANFNGSDSFTYKVNDSLDGTGLDSNLATVTLTVAAVNDVPVASDLQIATDEDTPVIINLLAAASDVDGDTLTPVLVAGHLHGQLQLNFDGSFNYVADLDYFGTDSFTYKVVDGDLANGGLESNIVTVSLNIAAVNDAPVAVSATVTGAEDTPYIFSWSDFKVSDVDSDNLFITINELPLNGLLQYFDGLMWTGVISGQRISKADIDAELLCFGPDANESGFAGYNLMGTGNNKQSYASFTYQADDGYLTSAIASTSKGSLSSASASEWGMTLNITPVADTPALALAAPVDEFGATALLFSTSWETASNRSPTFTILPQATLEGWNVVRETGDTGQQAFILWSSGDKMKDANNTNRIVYAAGNPLPNPLPQAGEGTNGAQGAANTSSGNNWLEMGDAMGLGHQTYGIELQVMTRAGASYNLSLDYAG